MKILKKLLCLLFLLSFILNAEIKVLSKAGKGVLLEKDGQKVLLLKGSFYEMGYQHGKLLKDEIEELINNVLMISFATKIDDIEKAFEKQKNYIPERYIEEMKGMADATGLSLKKIVLANTFPELFHCSGIFLSRDATENKEMFHVRILDYLTDAGLQKFSKVIIFQPDGYNSFISASFSGFIGVVSGMNDKKIAIGEMGGKGYGDWDGIPMVFLMRKAFEEAKNLDEAVDIFKNNKRTCEYYYLISDGTIGDARGIYATSKNFEILLPSQSHPKLPQPFPKDTILMTAPNRYKTLRERVMDNYGKINIENLIEIIKEPVSMKSNLHNAIFLPEKLKMYLAVAQSPDVTNFQACYQKYYEYDYQELIKYYPENGERIQKIETKAEINNILPEEKIKEGILEKEEIKDFSEPENENLKNYLKFYEVPKKDIPYKLIFKTKTEDFYFYSLTFPSLVTTPYPELNTVYCEYFKSVKDIKKPPVILLDIQMGNLFLPRLIGYKLAQMGINSLIVELPVFGTLNRKIKGGKLPSSLDSIGQLISQGINDIRVAASILNQLENTEDINLCGISFGALVGALYAGIDGNLKKVCLLLGGGNLSEIIKREENFNKILKEGNFSEGMLKFLMIPFDPLTYSSNLKKTDVLMINAKDDSLIPKECAEVYYQSLKNKEIIWYPGDHYSLKNYFWEIFDRITGFFNGN